MTETNIKKKTKFKTSPEESRVFNRSLVKFRRNRIAPNFHEHDFLVQEISDHLIDNLQDVKKSFSHILSLNLKTDQFSEQFQDTLLFHQDLSDRMLNQKAGLLVQADEELLPFKNNSFDLVLSCLTLHWVNDLPGTLKQIFHCLKPDGLFLGAMFGGETLKELRSVIMKAELELKGGISPHISPCVDVRDAGALMQRAGFSLPVVNTERITVTYSDAFSLMKELKAMGENNALINQFKGLSSKRVMLEAAKIYHELYANNAGRIPATFDIIYFQGWSPHESQQKPLKPGSAKISLKDALDTFPHKKS